MLLLPLFVSLLNLIFGYSEIEMVFAGDAMQHKDQLQAARTSDGLYDYSTCFKDIAPMVRTADYAVVNLETPVGDKNFSGYPCFNAPSAFARSLADAGFSMMLTANNHCLDRSDRGLHATIDTLDAIGADHIGTYHDAAHRQESSPYIRSISGIKVGFVNYTYGTNGINVRGDAVVNYIDRGIIASDIAALRDAGAEIICAAIHWGIEYKLLPNAEQRSLADYLVSLGVDMIIGGHPHVIQPMEIRHSDKFDKDVLVVYSLGNFISAMKTRDTRGGAMVRVKIKRGYDRKAKIEGACYHLVFTVPPTEECKNYRVMPVDECPERWKSAAKAFERSATEIFDRHNIGVRRDAY